MNCENAFFHEGRWPDQLQKVAFGYQMSAGPYEGHEHVMSLRLQGDNLAALGKPPFRHIQRELSKSIDFRSHEKPKRILTES
jgi:hypothetical protein